MKSKKSNTVSCKLTTVIMSFLFMISFVYFVSFTSHSNALLENKTSMYNDYERDIYKASEKLSLLIENVKYHSNMMQSKPEAHIQIIPKILKLMDVAASVEELLGHIHAQADQNSFQYPARLDTLYGTLLVESKLLEELAERVIKTKNKNSNTLLRGSGSPELKSIPVPGPVPPVLETPISILNVQTPIKPIPVSVSMSVGPPTPVKSVIKNSPSITASLEPNPFQIDAVGTALLIICSSRRPDYLQKTLSFVLKFHPRIGFPVILSEDGASPQVKSIIDTFRKEIQRVPLDMSEHSDVGKSKLYIPSSKIKNIEEGIVVPVIHLHHPNSNEHAENGYFKLSKHFKYALGVVFDHPSHESFSSYQSISSPHLSGQMLISPTGFERVIVLEEDIQISPDFFEFFSSVTTMLDNDDTILCASAWNDNGFANLINPTLDGDKLVRSDFFPGLGWMFTKKLWMNELSTKWPRAYWDDWLREPPQRKNRHTIRPEICRTYHFGTKGVSGGQYNSYLNDISLNEKFQPLTALRLDYLQETAWNNDKYMDLVKKSEIVTKQTFSTKRDAIFNRNSNSKESLRVIYTSLDGREPTSFVSLAKWAKCMDNIKANVPRTAYKGIVSIWKDGIKLHLTPSSL